MEKSENWNFNLVLEVKLLQNESFLERIPLYQMPVQNYNPFCLSNYSANFLIKSTKSYLIFWWLSFSFKKLNSLSFFCSMIPFLSYLQMQRVYSPRYHLNFRHPLFFHYSSLILFICLFFNCCWLFFLFSSTLQDFHIFFCSLSGLLTVIPWFEL